MHLFPDKPFQITYGNTVLTCTPVPMPDRFAFHIAFSSNRKPLLVVRAKDFNYERFWTSMPEGRQTEAEGVGKLIEEYINTNLKNQNDITLQTPGLVLPHI